MEHQEKLEEALRGRDYEEVERLLAVKGDVETLTIAMNDAASLGDPIMVRMLADRGARLDGDDDMGICPPLLSAAYGKHWDIAEFLVKRGASPDACCENADNSLGFDSVLSLAIKSKNKGMVDLLFKHGANPNNVASDAWLLEKLIGCGWIDLALPRAKQALESWEDDSAAEMASAYVAAHETNPREIMRLLQVLAARGMIESDVALELYDGNWHRIRCLIRLCEEGDVTASEWKSVLKALVSHAADSRYYEGLGEEAARYYEAGNANPKHGRALAKGAGAANFTMNEYCYFQDDHRPILDACEDKGELFDAIVNLLSVGLVEESLLFVLQLIPELQDDERILRIHEYLFSVLEQHELSETWNDHIPDAYGPLIDLGERALPVLMNVLQTHDMNGDKVEAIHDALLVLARLGPAAETAFGEVLHCMASGHTPIAGAARDAMDRILGQH